MSISSIKFLPHLLFTLLLMSVGINQSHGAVARDWNEVLLNAIRADQARPTVHARNLYHISAAMYDAWCVYDNVCNGVFYSTKHSSNNVASDRQEAISYAAYRLLIWRFTTSVGAETTLLAIDEQMAVLGYDSNITTTIGNSPASIGNRIAQTIINFGLNDGANESNDYINQNYLPINDPLLPDLTGNPDISDPNRWQPLALEFFEGQSGVITEDYPEFLSPEWGFVTPFSM